jgi:RNA recognition motif-containing protein
MSFRVFAGNLAFQVTDEDLRQAFAAFGRVRFSRVILDRETGKSRGFGFIEMDDEEEGRKAITQLDGTDLKGRQLRLREAEPRQAGPGGEPRPAGPGRFEGPRRDGPRPGGDRRGPGGPPPSRFGPRPDSRPGAARGPGMGRRDDAAGPRGTEADRDRNRRGEPRRARPEEHREGSTPQQGRPQEKVRGGAKNRFRLDDDEGGDEDINLFESYHEDEEYDLGDVEGVEVERPGEEGNVERNDDDSDEPRGIQIPPPADQDRQ